MSNSIVSKVYLILAMLIVLTGCANAVKQMMAISANGFLIISYIVLATSLVSKNIQGIATSIIGICITYIIAGYVDYLEIDFPFIKAITDNFRY
ncbi:hypothetical protein ILS92_09635 [Acinetobacter baumannii]|nr:hypothetical protein [Acinetobacter baumannii]HCW5913680.1 hypothetical protein [Acinetobacter baumannii]